MVSAQAALVAQVADPPERADDPPMFDLIELMFFAYRDFVGDADRLLDTYGFGRAHHRVLHFVHRQPGLRVADLLDILRITKQSLNRVMKDLLDAGFIEVRSGLSDRRQRLLYASAGGARLALDLAVLQSARFREALTPLGAEARTQAALFLLGMVQPSDRDRVSGLVWTDQDAGQRTGQGRTDGRARGHGKAKIA